MVYLKLIAPIFSSFLLTSVPAPAQGSLGTELAELMRLKDKVGNLETRIRVDATHRVWAIGLASVHSEVKSSALELLGAPTGSSSDHIRMPAVYAIAEIANSSDDVEVKKKALAALREPLKASQVPIRDVAIDAINSIVRGANRGDLALAAVQELGHPVRSGNNGVRIPAINAIVRAVENSHNDGACNAALDALVAPLDSIAAIGGMEVRMYAVAAVEKVGLEATEIRTKAKAMGLMQSYADKGSWEPEAKKRAGEAAANIQKTIKK